MSVKPVDTPAVATEAHMAGAHAEHYQPSCPACVHLLAHAVGHGSYVTLDEELRATVGYAPVCTCK